MLVSGTAPLLTDLLAGQLDIVNDNLPADPQLAREGKVKLLAVTSAERWYSAPEVRDRLRSFSIEPAPQGAADLPATWTPNTSEVVRTAKIRLE